MSVFSVRQTKNSKVCSQKHWLILKKGANSRKRKTKIGNFKKNAFGFGCRQEENEEDHLL